MTDILFYIFSTLLVGFSILVVALPNLLHRALSLVASFFVTAALYLHLQMEFVALSQIMLYIGGIVVFIIIIILLTTGLGEENRFKVPSGTTINGAVISCTLLAAMLYYLSKPMDLSRFKASSTIEAGSLEAIGTRLLSTAANGFIVPFEIISVLLLIALVGAVVIARKEKTN